MGDSSSDYCPDCTLLWEQCGCTEDFDDEDRDCLICGGEGWVFGESFGDPLWYDEDEVYACKSCGGSGLRKDMTFW